MFLFGRSTQVPEVICPRYDLGLISFFLINRQIWVVLDGKYSQDYPVNAWVPQGSILGPALFLLYINELPDNVVCNIAIFPDDTTLYSKCDMEYWGVSALLITKTPEN